MSLSAPFIHRPVGTSLLTAAVALAGALAYQFLAVSPLPQVDNPVIAVSASLPGASPEIMASSVATPLERQFGRIANITEMTSSSQLGSTSVVMQFELNRNIDAAARDVQAAINASLGNLPADLPGLPSYRKVNPADAPIMILAITSNIYDRGKMYDAASTVLAQKLSQVQGVGQVSVGGGALPAVRVDVNPAALNNLGLGLEDVRNFLQLANSDTPKGDVHDQLHTWMLETTDQLLVADKYRTGIVAFKNGAAIRLSDIADVTDSVENIRNMGIANGKPAIVLQIFRQPGANIIEVADRIASLIDQLQAEIPAGMRLSVVMDRTTTIRASVHDTQTTLLTSLCLVVAVVFIFLRNIRSTVIPAVAVPVSLIGTFGVMWLLNYSVDNLSLMALTIATGFVVDDAIVVIENITRHLEQGLPPMQAALVGAREIGFTVVSMSTSLVAVFIPILLMGGLVGRLFREFSVTLSVAIGISMIVSLTTTPMMCALFLKPKSEERHGKIYQFSERIFNAVLKAYESTLSAVLHHPAVVTFVTIATICLTIYLYGVIPKGLFPDQDTGRLGGGIMADQQTSFQAISKIVQQVTKILAEDPDVVSEVAFAGGNGPSNRSFTFVVLRPIPPRTSTPAEIIARLRVKLARVPGAQVFLNPFQDVRTGGRSSNATYQYTLQDDNLKELTTWAPRLTAKLRELPDLMDVNSDQQDNGISSNLTIDRLTAARLGINSSILDNVLYDAFGQRQVSTMFTTLNQYHVVEEVQPKYSQSPEGLKHIYVPAADGAQVPLSAFTRYDRQATSLTVNHQGQFPAITLSFNLKIGISLGQAIDQIHAAEISLGMPASIHGSEQGTALVFKQSLENQPFLIAAALITVYIVLGMLYESLVHPITILSTLPSAGVGALLALLVFHVQLDLVGLIGIILLIGIVKKNAIMMIDFAIDAERRGGKTPYDAIFEACMLRFRPIMMTTLAAMFGGLPLALGHGNGAELRRPLGIAIVGGLLFSQMLTLYTTPVIYLQLDRLRLWLKGLGRPTPDQILVSTPA